VAEQNQEISFLKKQDGTGAEGLPRKETDTRRTRAAIILLNYRERERKKENENGQCACGLGARDILFDSDGSCNTKVRE